MRRLTYALVLLLALTAAAPAAAGWLVTSDGNAIETDGGWEVRGALVVFKQVDGQLASIRLSEVDLEASEARTAQPARSENLESTPPPRPPGAVMVLTDADVRHARVAGPRPEDQADSDQETETPTAPAPERRLLEVTGWQDQINVEAGALEVTGSLANHGTGVATNTRLEVRLLDGTGRLVQKDFATIVNNVLGPGSSSPFKASFPGSPGYAAVEFEVQSRGFKVRSPAATE